MKLLCCADLRLGADCAENLSTELARRWRAARAEKLENLFDKASQNNASYVALFGRLFGQERVSESAIDALFRAITSEPRLQTLLFVNYEEYSRLSYRSDKPENLHLLCTQSHDAYLDDHMAVSIRQGVIELLPGLHEPLRIEADADGRYSLGGKEIIPALEPLSFEDAQEAPFGYGLIEWTEETPAAFRTIVDQKFAFETVEVKLLPTDSEKEILRKINRAINTLDRDSFLRIRLVGRSAFGLTINADALAEQLQSKLFFAEVFDSTVMDIDTDAFETDISLRSEFVRLAMQDESLSESERNRLISCGWSALGEKGAYDA